MNEEISIEDNTHKDSSTHLGSLGVIDGASDDHDVDTNNFK